MSDIGVYIQPDNGDYLLLNGAIQNNNSLLTEMYFALNTPLGSYIYDQTLGNQLLNLQYVPKTSEITSMLTNALTPLISANRIKNVQIQIILAISNSYSVLINCVDSTGNPVEFKWVKV